jgi:serine/threonine protein kinase
MADLVPDQWKALSPYLDEALEKTGEDRAAWLTAVRDQNPGLADQLEIIIREHDSLREAGFLEQRTAGLPEEAGLAGKTLGAYKLLKPVGQGGMGSVWLAERNDGRFQRRVAVKFLNLALMGKTGEERFKREGRILALLVHPNIAELVDAGVSRAGQPYLILEHIEGDHIDQYCDQNKLGVGARLGLFLDVLGAVAQAHANIIVHRDLKPSNVLVRNDGQVKLLDFGIAKLLEVEGPGAETILTVDGGRALTPEYAAPEQLTGGAVTTATDVYALGVLLYVLLTGQHPAGNGPHNPADLVRAVVDTMPTRLSDTVLSRTTSDINLQNATNRATTPEKLRRRLRGDLDTIVAKALKKDPKERYASVTAMADDIRRYLLNQPISALPDTLAYCGAKFVRRNRTVVALTTLAIVATATGLVGTLIQSRTARAQRDFAFRQVARGQALNDFHEFLLSDAAPSGKPFTVNELLERAEQIVERKHAANDPNRVVLMISIGSQYVAQDEGSRARRVLEEAYQLSRSLSDPSVRAEASCTLAGSLARDEELERAEALFNEGLRELPNAPQFTLERVDCLHDGSEIAQENGDTQESVARAEAAQRVLKESPFDSEALELHRWTDLAMAYASAGNDLRAVSAFERAGALLSSLGLDNTGTAVNLFNNWAIELDQLGRPMDAETMYRRAIDISRSSQSEEAVSPMILNNYAKVLRELSHIKEAEDYAERAYAKAQRVGHQLAINQALLERARIYAAQGQPARARAVLAEVKPRLEKSLPPGHYGFAALASAEALAALAAHDIPMAWSLADQAVSIDEAAIKAGGEGNYVLPTLLIHRSVVALEARRADLAAADASRALDLLRADNYPRTFSCVRGNAYLALGRALQAQGKREESRAAFRSAADNLQSTVGRDHPDTRNARQLAESGAGSVA